MNDGLSHDFLMRTLFGQSPLAISLSYPSDSMRIVHCNLAFETLFGYSEREAQSLLVTDLLTLPHEHAAKEEYRRVLAGDLPRFQVERLATRKGGEKFWARVTVTVVRSANGEPEAVIRRFEDCTAEHNMREELRRNELHYRLLAEHSSDVTFIVEHGVITYASPSTERILGYAPATIIGKAIRDFVHTEDISVMDATTEIALSHFGRTLNAEYRIRHADGTWRVMETRGKSVQLDGKSMGYLNLRDVTERRAIEQRLVDRERQLEELAAQLERANRQLQDQAVRDPLTGVFNRRGFDDHLTRIWSSAGREESPVALLMIDVDHFKAFNDTYGHPEGDMCLTRIARSIVSSIRAYDVAARHGGDEFAVILPDTCAVEATAIAERIRLNINAIRIGHQSSPIVPWVTVSIGVVALVPSSKVVPADLVLQADAMLYAAKQNGRNQIVTAG